MIRKIHFFLGYCSVCFTVPLLSLAAEVTCSTEVSYSWTQASTSSNAEGGQEDSPAPAVESKTPPGDAEGSPAPAATGTGTATSQQSPAPTAGGTPPLGVSSPVADTKALRKPRVVLFARVERSGDSEENARNVLDFEVERQKSRAAERCKRAHESVGECVTTKLSGKASTLNSLSFSARAQAEKALIDECKVQEGRCLSVDTSKAMCRATGAGANQAPSTAQSGTQSAPSAGASKPADKAEPKKADGAAAKPAAKKK
jgi:hypothetical protein